MGVHPIACPRLELALNARNNRAIIYERVGPRGRTAGACQTVDLPSPRVILQHPILLRLSKRGCCATNLYFDVLQRPRERLEERIAYLIPPLLEGDRIGRRVVREPAGQCGSSRLVEL